MKTWLKIWIPLGMYLVFEYCTNFVAGGTLGRMLIAIASIPGLFFIGISASLLCERILQKLGKV